MTETLQALHLYRQDCKQMPRHGGLALEAEAESENAMQLVWWIVLCLTATWVVLRSLVWMREARSTSKRSSASDRIDFAPSTLPMVYGNGTSHDPSIGLARESQGQQAAIAG